MRETLEPAEPFPHFNIHHFRHHVPLNDLLREIARFLFPRLNCRQLLQEELYRKKIIALIAEGVGGFVLFEGTVDECARAIEILRREEGERSLLLAADCEHGLTMRFEGGTEFPSAWALGSADDPDLTYKVAAAIGREMCAVGLDWNFAPVLDVNTNPDNPVINVRSFGEDPDHVARHGAAYVRGLQKGGVLSSGKHFPGHGDTAVDSHIRLPLLPFDELRLNDVELVPFRAAIEAGVSSLMSAHLAVPTIDPSGDPASLSAPILNGLLRGTLGYDGVIVTDALDMGAVVETYGTAEAVVRAFLAGNDVLEIPDDPFAALQGLRNAVSEERISAERIAESGGRLDAILHWRASRPSFELPANWREEHERLALHAARKALKIQPSGGSVSLRSPLVAVLLRDETARTAAERWMHSLNAFFKELEDVEIFEIEVGSWDAGMEERLRQALRKGGTPLLMLMIRPRGGAGSVGLGEREVLLTNLLRDYSPVLINFGNPYLLRELEASLRIDAFSSSMPSLEAVLEALSEIRL